MARSLGLATYRALTRRGDATVIPGETKRPDGEVIWLHVAEPGNLHPARDLARRLCATRAGACVLMTTEDDVASSGVSSIFNAPPPGEHPAAVAAFLDHWKPDTCIWTWGALRPNLILEAHARGIRMALVDADTAGFDGRRDRWLPDVTRQVLSSFDVLFARSQAAEARLSALGVSMKHMKVTAPLQAGGHPLEYADTDLSELSSAMRGRPAWFAVNVTAREIPLVLMAHQQALRLSHRLLLILNPADDVSPEDINAMMEEYALTAVRWDDGFFPDDATQVLVAKDGGEKGLFYRLAPVSFMGGTLFDGSDDNDPLDAAALGSAILYGPKVGRFMPSYSRLAAAGAARIVNDANTLGTAVSRLIAPDQAAAMAMAGWDVASQGATVVDQVIEYVNEVLDLRETPA
jgi:3-deoxy-D-manno-octulosonic-acid transferase